MTVHSFGGPWTMVKLELLERYLAFFNTALQHRPSAERPFKRIYIDAFAGTGSATLNWATGAARPSRDRQRSRSKRCRGWTDCI